MYADEAGDTGLVNSPTPYFIVSGIVIHELRWQPYFEQLLKFRQDMRQKYGLKLREEFHAARLISKPGELVRVKRHDRLAMIRTYAKTLATMTDLSIINIYVDKKSKTAGYDVFGMAWKALIQRFENTMSWKHFPSPANPDERGILLFDQTADARLIRLMRQMRHFNPIPHHPTFGTGYRNLPLSYMVEDAASRNSAHSYFIQSADLVTFLLYQHLAPCVYAEELRAELLFEASAHSLLARIFS